MIPPPDVVAARVDRARLALRAALFDALLVTHLPNICYLTGFAGSAAALLVAEDGLELIVDERYRAALAPGSAHDTPRPTVVPAGRSVDEILLTRLAERGHRRVGFEAAHLTVAHLEVLRRLIPARTGLELLPTEGIVEGWRLRKDSFEQATLRTAAQRLSAVVQGVLADLRAGLREWDVAARLEAGMRRVGFARTAFDTIVASGANAALPHHRASERRLAPGDLTVLDFGGVYNGYCVDLSRTVAIGRPSPEAFRLYSAVAQAHAAALAAVRPGVLTSDVDAAARRTLAGHGLADAFTHSTGHGLGLEAHEAPRLGQPRRAGSGSTGETPTVLQAGMVVTIEPGAYLPGFGGVRIEDDVLVTPEGSEVLTTTGRELTIVDC
jgi:Xaa-Pro aminopeptidase